MKNILAVETSCDDTSVAIVREDDFVLFNEVARQDALHQPYGGVVPELASRNHAQKLFPLMEKALNVSGRTWKDIEVLSVTNRPGLHGSLMTGLVTVKTLSFLLQKPYLAVNHIEGHILSPFLWDKNTPRPALKFPFLALIVSGGHTSLFMVRGFGQYSLIAQTVDDSAGEALDKVARLLGLNYPGGAEMDKISLSVSAREKYTFPKVVLKDQSLNFSFSGLKTQALQMIRKSEVARHKNEIPDFCADFQNAVVDHLMDRLHRAVQQYQEIRYVVIAGGVSANSRLRQRAKEWAQQHSLNLFLPPMKYCTDNAGMIGLTGWKRFEKGERSPQNLNCFPHSLPEDFHNL